MIQQEKTRQNVKRRSITAMLVGLVMCVAMGALVCWVGCIAMVQYRYQRYTLTEENVKDLEFLSKYSLELRLLLRMDPANGQVRNRYATVLGLTGDHKNAGVQLVQAMRTTNAQNSLFFLADMYEKSGRRDLAEQTMARCLIINPNTPQFNDAYLRLLHQRLLSMKADKKTGRKINQEEYAQAHLAFAQAARSWAVRAPADINSYLFLANFYIDPLFALQAYRCYLVGLAQPGWMNLNRQMMIHPRDALGTVNQIIKGKFAKAYRGLP